jgi:hypothetical protein
VVVVVVEREKKEEEEEREKTKWISSSPYLSNKPFKFSV